jgi:transcription antitermination factor NusG
MTYEAYPIVTEAAKLHPVPAAQEILTPSPRTAMRDPEAAIRPHWFAAYTFGNHEKRVAETLAGKGLEHFLPLYQSVRRWSDRRVRLQRPLFPGYVFVRMATQEKLNVQKIQGVVRLVGFNGQLTALPDDEIEILRRALTTEIAAVPHPFRAAGARVRIVRGPLAGLSGLTVRRKGSTRVVLSIELIQRSVIVDMDAADLESIHES